MEISSFETSKGSVYCVIDYHCTERMKYNMQPQPRSDLTVYVAAVPAYLMSCIFPDKGCITYFSIRKQSFIFATDASTCHEIDYVTEPANGLCPIEIWGTLDNIESMHIGHPIVGFFSKEETNE